MTYIVSNTDGSLTLAIEDNTINGTDYSVVLLGKNVIDYGRYFAQNSIRQLENFAGATPPMAGTILQGQLWFDKNTETLKVNSGSWRAVSTQHAQVDKIINYGSVDNLPPNANVQYAGAIYNNVDKKLYIDNGTRIQVAGYGGEVTTRYSTNTALGRPNNYGTRVRTIYLKDTADVPRAVLAMVYVNDTSNGSMNRGTTTTRWGKETIMMIMSDHGAFAVKNDLSYTEGEEINYYPELSGSGGIGTTIKRGTNVRTDYSAAVEFAQRSEVANVAFWMNNSGNINSPNIAGYFPGSNVIHTGRSYIPHLNNIVLGNDSSRFASGAINSLLTNTLTVGSIASNPSTGYTLPVNRGTSGQVLTTYGNGSTTWSTVSGGGGASGVSTVTAGAGLTGGGSTSTVTLDVNPGTGITVAGDAVGIDTAWLFGYIGTSAPAPGTIGISDEGSPLTGSATSINFTGAGVTATASGTAVTVTIPGSAGITVPGSSGQVLYNNSGALGALSQLTYTAGTPNTFALLGNLNITRNGATTNGAINFGSGNKYLKFEGGIFTLAAPLLINNTGGSEGGEIRLQKPASGSTLSGDLTIDSFQNRIRFFDSAGTNKGMYATITDCADAVGTEIIHSSNFATYLSSAFPNGVAPKPRAYGLVNTLGTIAGGTGFTVSAFSGGVITVTVTNNLGMTNASKIIPIVTPHSNANGLYTLAVDIVSGSSFRIYTGGGANSWAAINLKFSFAVYYADDLV